MMGDFVMHIFQQKREVTKVIVYLGLTNLHKYTSNSLTSLERHQIYFSQISGHDDLVNMEALYAK